MKKIYAGSAGLFLKGLRYDLPAATLKLLPKGSYRKTKPPWNPISSRNQSRSKSTNKSIESPKDKQARPGKPGSNYKTKQL